MEVLIKDKAVTTILEEIASAFAALYPEVYADFLEIVRSEEEHLVKPNGMSAEGTMMSWYKIPSPIYSFVKIQMRKRCGIPDFFKDYENHRLLLRVWSDCKVKRTPTTRLEVHQ